MTHGAGRRKTEAGPVIWHVASLGSFGPNYTRLGLGY